MLEFRDIVTWKRDCNLKDQKSRRTLFADSKGPNLRNIGSRATKENMAQENDYSRCSNTDEYSKISVTKDLNSPDSICCPFCHKRIDSLIEKLMKDIKQWMPLDQSLKSKLEDFQLTDKIKTYHFPAKKSFLSNTANHSRIIDSGRMSDTSVTSLNAQEGSTQNSGKGQEKSDMSLSQVIYEVSFS